MIPVYGYLLLGALGLILGTQINRLIYDWAWFVELSPSPYSRKKRLGVDSNWRYVPVVGWWWMRNFAGQTLYPTSLALATPEERPMITLITKWTWLRPTLVELFSGLGVPFLAWYIHSGTWLGFAWSPDLIPGQLTTLWVWVAFHLAMITLLVIAALIDWDERTIPDEVTTTGVVLALLVFAIWPQVRLPNVEFAGLRVSKVESIHAFSPQEFPTQAAPVAGELPPGVLGWTFWERVLPILDPCGWTGLWTACLCWVFWAVLIIPSRCTLRFGWRKAVWLAWASVIRPPRKTTGLAAKHRKVSPVTWVALAVMGLGWLVAIWTWNSGAERWEAVYSLSVSMLLAGLGTWSIRLLATRAMGMEALGFGDVTLMFMISAAFGWQFALLVFPLAAVLAIGYVVFRMITSADKTMALGPWLSLAAILLLLAWYPAWHEHTRQQVFGMGPLLLPVIAICLCLLPCTLLMLVFGKRLLGLEK
ncbi:MAG: prepilin peptidase [Planctomycetaceae bacterium]|nr:prepilin peptidase [Planctomycetaceae bacterium]